MKNAKVHEPKRDSSGQQVNTKVSVIFEDIKSKLIQATSKD